MLLDRALRADMRRRPPRLHARGARVERRRIASTRLGFERRGVRRGYYTDNREDALIMWRDPVRDPARVRDPWARDLVRRDRRGPSSRRTARVLSNVVASQAELHARYGGVVPEIASRRHLELVSPVVREALDRAGAVLDDLDRIAVTRGPGLIGALLVGLAAAKALAWGRGLPLVPVDHLHGHVASLFLQPTRSSRRSSACSRAAATRCCSTSGTRAASERLGGRSTTPPARRSTRARGCSGSAIPAVPRSTASRAKGDPLPSAFRSREVPGLDFSFSGSSPRSSTPSATSATRRAERKSDLAASYQHAVVKALVERNSRPLRDGSGADRRRRRRRRELRAPRLARGRQVCTAPAVHRQCRDGRFGR